jgi:tRNA(adenine34) deaminase
MKSDRADRAGDEKCPLAATPRGETAARKTTRRAAIATLAMAAFTLDARSASGAQPSQRWYEAAVRMKRMAEASGDQPYGAVLVLDGRLVGEGPSRVVTNGDASAHAEREAIRHAQRSLGRHDLAGAVLYSTSRPCALCEEAAARAGVSRMVFGPKLVDAGAPRAGSPDAR